MPMLSIVAAVDAVAKASLILALTALAAASLRRASASARHLVWTLGLLGALALPALATVTPRWELPIVTITDVAEKTGQHDNAATRERSAAGQQADSLAQAVTVSPVVRVTPVASSFSSASPHAPGSPSPAVIVLTIWAIGAGLVLGRMLLGLLAVQWMSRRTAVVTAAPWLEQALALAGTLGLRRVRFLRTRAQSMPMAWGMFRPSVLMPADADTWPTERLRIVLLHELAHVKRRDCLTHVVAQIACAAYWFNPLAWMAARRLRTERERACDDLVLAAGTRGSDYADQLLDIARVMRAERFPAVLAGATLAMAHRSQLEGRLMAILDPRVPRRGVTRASAAIAAAMFALLIVPVAAVQPWSEEPAATKAAMNPPGAPPQNVIQPAPAGTLKDGVQGGVAGGVTGGVNGGVADGIAGGVSRGIAEGVSEGVRGGVEGSIRTHVGRGIGAGIGTGVGVGVDVATGVAQSVVNGMANGIASAAALDPPTFAHEVAVEATPRGQRARKGDSDPRAVSALVDALKDTDKGVREAAMQALVQMRDPSVFEPLVAALKDSSADIRQQAAFGLGQLRDSRAVPALASLVKDNDANVREQAVFALGQLRAVSAIDAIMPALHDSSDSVREQATFALGQIRDGRAVDPLVPVLKDTNPSVRQQAAFALGQIRDARAVDALVIALKDANANVREQAAFALGQIRDPRAIDGLTTALKDSSASVRQQAAFALGQIR
jgi:HEAT repeat protein/beta-lactamase regulating signal transducer with metallopeptidase domain